MSKAAKIIAAVVVTVAAVVTLNPHLIAAAASMDAALIMDAVTPAKKITSTGQESRWKADPRAGIPYAVGRCAIAGYQVFQRSAPANTGKFKNFVTVYTGAGPIDGFESFLANDVPVVFSADSGEGASGYYLNRMWMKRQVGAASSPYLHWTATGSKDTPANHGGMPTEWTSAHELPGFAASLYGLEWDTTRFSGGVPTPRMVARWVKVYDPRKDSTYPGGSGSHRYADPSDKTAYLAAQATWEWSANPYLHGLMWCLGRYFGDPARLDLPLVKTHGLGAPMSKIEVANFVEGANVAQANAWTLGGEVSSTDDKWEVLKEFLEAGGGEPIMLGHKIGCMVNAPKVSLATITKADAIGDVSVASSTAIEDRINTIWPSYTEESLNWTLVPFDTPVKVSAYLAADKGERSTPMSLPLVQSPVQMAQLARYRIEDSRELTPIVIPAKPWTMWLRPGDCFTANEPEWGLNNQKLLILQRKRDPATMTVTFICRTETDGKHAFALGQTATPPDTPALTGLDVRSVPLPEVGAWTITGGQIAGPTGRLPAIVIEGECDFYGAQLLIVEYRKVLPGGLYGDWITEPRQVTIDTTQTLVFTGMDPGGEYDVRVRYMTATGVQNPTNNRSLGTVTVAVIDVAIGVNASVNSTFQAANLGYQNYVTTNNLEAFTHVEGLNYADSFVFYGDNNVQYTIVAANDAYWSVNQYFFGWGTAGFDTNLANLKRYALPVTVGDRVGARILLSAHGCQSVFLRLRWFNKAGGIISEIDFAPVGYVDARLGGRSGVNGTPANYYTAEGYQDAPATAAYAALSAFAYTQVGQANSVIFQMRPQLVRLASGQTVIPPYTPGPVDRNADKTLENVAAAILSQGTGATASTLAELNATDHANLQAALDDSADALAAAASAQSTADGKIDTFFATSAPSGSEGDIWFDADDGNKQYRYTAGFWIEVRDDGIGTAIAAAATAQSTADGKITTWYSTTAPSSPGIGDLWVDTDDPQRRIYRFAGGGVYNVIADQTGFNIAAAILSQGPLATLTPPTYAGNAAAYAALGAGVNYLDSTNSNTLSTTFNPASAGFVPPSFDTWAGPIGKNYNGTVTNAGDTPAITVPAGGRFLINLTGFGGVYGPGTGAAPVYANGSVRLYEVRGGVETLVASFTVRLETPDDGSDVPLVFTDQIHPNSGAGTVFFRIKTVGAGPAFTDDGAVEGSFKVDYSAV